MIVLVIFPLNPSANSRMNSDHHFHGHPSERFHPSNSKGPQNELIYQ
jgi:hypothetical protein